MRATVTRAILAVSAQLATSITMAALPTSPAVPRSAPPPGCACAFKHRWVLCPRRWPPGGGWLRQPAFDRPGERPSERLGNPGQQSHARDSHRRARCLRQRAGPPHSRNRSWLSRDDFALNHGLNGILRTACNTRFATRARLRVNPRDAVYQGDGPDRTRLHTRATSCAALCVDPYLPFVQHHSPVP